MQVALPAKYSLVVRTALGVLLLLSAGLKAHGLFSGSLADSPLSSPRLQAATIELELVIGLWLLSGMPAARWGAIGLFSLFTIVSLYLALAGQRSCGCFGRVTVNPWITFALDLGAVLALLASASTAQGVSLFPHWGPMAFRTMVGVIAFVAIIAGAFVAASPQPADALARLRGELVTAEPNIVSVGTGTVGETRHFAITLANHSAEPIRISGGTANCNCLTTDDLPLTISPGTSRPVNVVVAFRGEPGIFQHQYAFYTEDARQRLVICQFGGRVIRPRD